MITVNGQEIAESAVAAEMQYHPAKNREAAWQAAATALVVRQLLLQEAERLGLALEEGAEGSSGEEQLIQALLAREISLPELDEESCRRYWHANTAKFRSPDLYEAAHILFAAAPEDEAARASAKDAAVATLALLQKDPAQFARLARERSACPSGASGGLLGQQSRGDLVPEFETFVMALEEGQICPVPVQTRYGYHVLRLDRRVPGRDLPYDQAKPAVERLLASSSWQRAVSQYLRILAGRAEIAGIALPGAASPLVQ
jgi:peptidyl-prolyl cis-trans isomerase C